MKNIKLLFSLLICFIFVMLPGCGKSSSRSAEIQKKNALKSPLAPKANHNMKPIKLGKALNFAIFASTSISSIPNSSIAGKIGLEPGLRSQITLISSEVVGGSSEIYAADDANPSSHLMLDEAHTDLVVASKELENREADSDKIGRYYGFLGGKTLPAGTYKWNSRVAIDSDLILEGASSDIWIFHVSGNFNMAQDVRVVLSGGALAKNVFWLVDGSLKLDEKSELVGTVIVKKIFTMKSFAILNGRAFSLNGNLVLDNNTITKPE